MDTDLMNTHISIRALRSIFKDEEHMQQQSYYLKKSMLGGILLFEVHLAQPFFIVKLHSIECNRLQTKTSSGMMNQVRQI